MPVLNKFSIYPSRCTANLDLPRTRTSASLLYELRIFFDEFKGAILFFDQTGMITHFFQGKRRIFALFLNLVFW